MVELTHAEGREFVMIIDESHKNVTDAAEMESNMFGSSGKSVLCLVNGQYS